MFKPLSGSRHAEVWFDTPERYGLVSRLFHWVMAGLLIYQFVIITCWRVFGRSDTMMLIASFTPSHGTVGVLTVVLVPLRFIWAVLNRKRRPAHGHDLQARIALFAHRALYALMFFIPALALLRSYGNGRGWEQWGVRLIPATRIEIAWMMAPANALHTLLAWMLCAAIGIHILAALVHRFVQRDEILSRMAGTLR